MNYSGRIKRRNTPAFPSFCFHCAWRLPLLVVGILGIVAASPAPGKGQTVPAPKADAKLTYKIIEAFDGSFGYDVFTDERLTIHQPSIPALPGNEGFKSKEAATKVALLVIDKIKKGEMPPTISIDEMKTVNAIK
jgi:hypothetical protein